MEEGLEVVKSDPGDVGLQELSRSPTIDDTDFVLECDGAVGADEIEPDDVKLEEEINLDEEIKVDVNGDEEEEEETNNNGEDEEETHFALRKCAVILERLDHPIEAEKKGEMRLRRKRKKSPGKTKSKPNEACRKKMRRHGCFVLGCYLYEDEKVNYHHFPKDRKMIKKWAIMCRGSNHLNYSWPNQKVCAKHFKEEDYERDLRNELLGLATRMRLKKEAFPSLLLGEGSDDEVKDIKLTKREKVKAEKERKALVEKILKEHESKQEQEVVSTGNLINNLTPSHSSSSQANVKTVVKTNITTVNPFGQANTTIPKLGRFHKEQEALECFVKRKSRLMDLERLIPATEKMLRSERDWLTHRIFYKIQEAEKKSSKGATAVPADNDVADLQDRNEGSEISSERTEPEDKKEQQGKEQDQEIMTNLPDEEGGQQVPEVLPSIRIRREDQLEDDSAEIELKLQLKDIEVIADQQRKIANLESRLNEMMAEKTALDVHCVKDSVIRNVNDFFMHRVWKEVERTKKFENVVRESKKEVVLLKSKLRELEKKLNKKSEQKAIDKEVKSKLREMCGTAMFKFLTEADGEKAFKHYAWSEEEIKKAFVLCRVSPKAYEYIRAKKMMPLPNRKALFDQAKKPSLDLRNKETFTELRNAEPDFIKKLIPDPNVEVVWKKCIRSKNDRLKKVKSVKNVKEEKSKKRQKAALSKKKEKKKKNLKPNLKRKFIDPNSVTGEGTLRTFSSSAQKKKKRLQQNINTVIEVDNEHLNPPINEAVVELVQQEQTLEYFDPNPESAMNQQETDQAIRAILDDTPVLTGQTLDQHYQVVPVTSQSFETTSNNEHTPQIVSHRPQFLKLGNTYVMLRQ